MLHHENSNAGEIKNVNGVKIGMKFHAARKILFRNGWRQLIYERPKDHYYNDPDKYFRNLNIKEVLECSVDGFCIFL
jgi:hypothetical protein